MRAIMTPNQTPVVIIGGGISGLSAAWYLQKQGVPYALLEQSRHWGGKIRTELVDGYGAPFVVEAGPDSFLTQKPWALQLALELGLHDRLLGTNDDRRHTYVLNRGKLTPLPEGVMLIVPTQFRPFVTSPLISWPGKLRLARELFLPARTDDADESLADFVRRRLGAEVLDKLAEPLLAGIYNTEAEKQSLLATFPRFRDLEKKYGSITRGMLEGRKARASAPPAKYSVFTSFKTGMRELVDGLLPRLEGDLRLETGVNSVAANPDGTYTLNLSDHTQVMAEHVVFTTPAYVTARLLADVCDVAADILADIRYVSTGTISLAYKRDTFNHPLDGFGVVIPRSEQRPINAVTWSSTKFNYRAPEDYVLLRVFFGGSRSPESFELDDAALLRTVRSELRAMMGVEAEPVFTRIFRWREANPQYDVGHLDRIDALEAVLPAGLHVTGSAYRGIGVPDCVRQAQDTAAKVAESVKERA
ncbi:MAG: protoporphyrinogen oxidase [Anaerolineae bacterium]|nr:protoporphyrinogen oxidase [Anaerolineae bacterium]